MRDCSPDPGHPSAKPWNVSAVPAPTSRLNQVGVARARFTSYLQSSKRRAAWTGWDTRRGLVRCSTRTYRVGIPDFVTNPRPAPEARSRIRRTRRLRRPRQHAGTLGRTGREHGVDLVDPLRGHEALGNGTVPGARILQEPSFIHFVHVARLSNAVVETHFLKPCRYTRTGTLAHTSGNRCRAPA